METVIVTRNKESIISTEAILGEDLLSGLDIRLNIYSVVGTTETDVLLDQLMTESVKQPGIYLFPWTPTTAGNYRIDIFEKDNTNELAQTFNIIKVTDTDIDEVVDAITGGTTYIDLGVIQTFEQNSNAVLEILLYDAFGGSLINADSLPTVNVLNENGVTVKTADATLVSTGRYSFTYSLAKSAGIGTWKYVWNLTVSGNSPTIDKRTQPFQVIVKACIGGADTREGFAFDNPNLTMYDDFGGIITPDELRYVYAFGNDLNAPNGATITDETLQWYIDNAIKSVERDLNITLIKKIYKHRQPDINTARTDLPAGTPGIDYYWEEPYDFHAKEYREYLYIKLRRRPILSFEKAVMLDATGQLIINLLDFGPKPNYMKGSIEFFPVSGSLTSISLTQNSILFSNLMRVRNRYPDAYFFDYTAGFEKAQVFRNTWGELFPVIGKVAAISLLSDYGDGKTAGLASSSIGLAGISESLSTTLSATSAAYGARILQYTNELKAFFKANRYKYSGILFGAL